MWYAAACSLRSLIILSLSKEHELHKASEEKELQATLLLPLEGLKAEEMQVRYRKRSPPFPCKPQLLVQGRISGSTAWRSARGELGEEKEDTSGGSAGSSNGAAAIDVAALTSLAVSAIGKEGRRVEAARVCDNGALLAGACCSMEWLQWGSVPLVDGEAVLCCSSAGLTGQQLVVLTSRGRWLITNAIDAEGKEGRGPKWVEFKVDVRARINPVSTVVSVNGLFGVIWLTVTWQILSSTLPPRLPSMCSISLLRCGCQCICCCAVVLPSAAVPLVSVAWGRGVVAVCAAFKYSVRHCSAPSR